MYSPRWLYFGAGTWALLVGISWLRTGTAGNQLLRRHARRAHVAGGKLAVLLGSQLLQFAVFAKTFAVSEGLVPQDQKLTKFLKVMSLERCLLAGVVSVVAGGGLMLSAVSQWSAVSFGALDYATTMRWVIPGVTLIALGCQTIFSSFFVSILRMGRSK